MSRTQAECRHHGRHMKQKRRQYFRVFSRVSPRMAGIIARPKHLALALCLEIRVSATV